MLNRVVLPELGGPTNVINGTLSAVSVLILI
jgi:hypothetical protein